MCPEETVRRKYIGVPFWEIWDVRLIIGCVSRRQLAIEYHVRPSSRSGNSSKR
jgi:hypothetical protein